MASRSYCTIYVGNLPLDVKEWEIEDLFYKFEDPLDAEDAIKGRDGYNFDRCRIRVELAHGGRGQSSRGEYGGGSEVVEDNLVLLVGEMLLEQSSQGRSRSRSHSGGPRGNRRSVSKSRSPSPTRSSKNVCKWLASAE
ncbi:hypothetical protein V6N12_056016 [Hibiscus sabdariffa]|uniref:RRM domain-containing protein n=1 Tax=Hibiscus sabdariffa TaxID=183260 RepID=A0ABR2CR90_9ROSI